MAEAERWWSVGLVVADSDASTLSSNDLAMIMFPDGVRSLRFGPRDGEEDVASIGFELLAVSAEAAEGRAQNLAFQARRAAKLSVEPLPVAWAVPLRDEEESSARFLDEARDLIDEEQFELAVVAAQIHLEVQVKTMLEVAAETDGPGWLEVLLNTKGIASLGNRQTRVLIRELLGIEIGTVDEWSGLQEHLARRNAIVHDGQAVKEKEAAESVAVVEAMVRHLSKASRGE